MKVRGKKYIYIYIKDEVEGIIRQYPPSLRRIIVLV